MAPMPCCWVCLRGSVPGYSWAMFFMTFSVYWWYIYIYLVSHPAPLTATKQVSYIIIIYIYMVVFVLFFIMVHGGIYIIIHVASWVGWGLQSETRTITPIYARGSSHECPWSVPDDKSFAMCRWFPTWLPNNLLQTGYITSLNGLVWGNIYRKPLKNCWLKKQGFRLRCSLKPTHLQV